MSESYGRLTFRGRGHHEGRTEPNVLTQRTLEGDALSLPAPAWDSPPGRTPLTCVDELVGLHGVSLTKSLSTQLAHEVFNPCRKRQASVHVLHGAVPTLTRLSIWRGCGEGVARTRRQGVLSPRFTRKLCPLQGAERAPSAERVTGLLAQGPWGLLDVCHGQRLSQCAFLCISS